MPCYFHLDCNNKIIDGHLITWNQKESTQSQLFKLACCQHDIMYKINTYGLLFRYCSFFGLMLGSCLLDLTVTLVKRHCNVSLHLMYVFFQNPNINIIIQARVCVCVCVSGLYTSAGLPGQRAHSQSRRTRKTPVWNRTRWAKSLWFTA